MARTTRQTEPTTVQSHPKQEPLLGGPSRTIAPLLFRDNQAVVSDWQSLDRDHWLRLFWRQFGNDMLSSVLATATAKVQAQSWYIEGPEKPSTLYHRLIRDKADFGKGYDYMVARGAQDYYTQDNGWFLERHRSGPDDHEGPCLGLAHLDSQRMFPSGNAEYPYYYEDIDGAWHLMHRSQYIRIVDLPDPATAMHSAERGFCAMSRAISTAMILTMLVAMKREKLSDLPPSALAVLNNISRKQFEAAIQIQTSIEDAKGNAVWRTVLPLFGMDPARPADIKFISLREVWEGFDEMTAMNVAAFSFAAAFRMDPREFWPVSGGTLGTGKEAELQHQKAKQKSSGLIFTQMERAFNHEDTLPEGVTFHFEMQETEDELQQAQIDAIHVNNIKVMQDAGANLSSIEVRWLLSMKYRILPKMMVEEPQPVNQSPQQLPQEEGSTAGKPGEGKGSPGIPAVPNAPGIPKSGAPGNVGTSPAPQQPEMKPPKWMESNTLRIDDTEDAFKEVHFDLGPRVLVEGSTGRVYHVRDIRPTTNGHTPEASIMAARDMALGGLITGASKEIGDLMDRINAMDPVEREAVLSSARRLRAITDPGPKLDFLSNIPDKTWDEAAEMDQVAEEG